MASILEAVPPPEAMVYRDARDASLFTPPPWEIADPETGTFGGRFDDPGKLMGIVEQDRFRIVYCASERAGAFGESIIRFRPPIETLARYRRVTAERHLHRVTHTIVNPDDPSSGIVPLRWRSQRWIGSAKLDPSLRFVDIASARAMNGLRTALADEMYALGLRDLDLGTVAGPHRLITQRCARYIYEQRSESGKPLFAGIRYLSRLNPLWECWAIFDSRVVYETDSVNPIRERDEDLLEVAALFGLSIESDRASSYYKAQ